MASITKRFENGFPVLSLSLDNVTVDPEIQSRVKTHPEFQMRFSEARLAGKEFPPIVVFFDGKTYWLADGFHRHGAFLKASAVDASITHIDCEVHEGTRRDAIIYSAGANQEFSIARSKADIRRACEMLFADEEWGKKSNKAISQFVGDISDTTVKIHRVAYHDRTNTKYPETTIDTRGRTNTTTKDMLHIVQSGSSHSKPRKAYGKTINGKFIHLGGDIRAANQKLQEIQESNRLRRGLFASERIRKFLTGKLIVPDACDFNRGSHPGLFGFIVRSHFVTWTPFEKPEDAAHAIGRALAGSLFAGTTGRKVVLCDPENGPAAVIELGRQLGVEFITPEAFVASLADEQGESQRKAQ